MKYGMKYLNCNSKLGYLKIGITGVEQHYFYNSEGKKFNLHVSIKKNICFYIRSISKTSLRVLNSLMITMICKNQKVCLLLSISLQLIVNNSSYFLIWSYPHPLPYPTGATPGVSGQEETDRNDAYSL